MKLLTHIPSWLKNKYFLSLAAFIAWMLFFDERDIFTVSRYRSELNHLQQSKKYYTEQITQVNTELEKLRYNPAILEKFAREKYYMKRGEEDLFIIPEANSR